MFNSTVTPTREGEGTQEGVATAAYVSGRPCNSPHSKAGGGKGGGKGKPHLAPTKAFLVDVAPLRLSRGFRCCTPLLSPPLFH